MGYFDGLFETKSATEGEAIRHAIAASPSGQSVRYASGGNWDIGKAVSQGYEKVIWVYRCVDAIATSLSRLDFVLRSGDARHGKIKKNDALNRLLNIKPNIYETADQFWYRVYSLGLLSRRGVFIEVVGGLKNPQSIHILPPGDCEPLPHPTTFVSGYQVNRAGGGFDTLQPDEVIWIKCKPHPTDVYAQMTPLVAAGIAIETDFLARMWNRNFLLNDGRPGLLVTVSGQMTKEDAEELKRRFSGGPGQAGQTTVIEGDGLDVADMSANARDVQYLESIAGSKQDILLAFGTPESMLGNASGRTFDNADAERENWWMDTLQPYGDAVGNSLDPFTGDLYDVDVIAPDYSVVDVLQRQEHERQAKALSEWQAGKITWAEMRERTGEDVWADNPLGDAIMLPSGFIMAKTPELQLEISKMPNVMMAQGGAAPGGDSPMGPSGIRTPIDPSEAARQGALAGSQLGARRFDNIISARTLQLTSRARDLAGKVAIDQVERMEKKDDEAEIIDANVVSPYEEGRTEMEAKAEGMLIAFDSRQAEVVAGRLSHKKARQGTRHWEGETKVVKNIDPEYVVQMDRWSQDMRDDFEAMLRPMFEREVQRAGRDMKGEGIIEKMIADGTISGAGKTPALQAFNASQHDIDALTETQLASVLDIIEKSVRTQSSRVAAKVKELDAAGKSMNQIQNEVRTMIGQRSKWRKELSIAMTTSGIEGIRQGVYGRAGTKIRKTWNTFHDDKVRQTHAAVDGQTRFVPTPFIVGGAKMMYPAQPGAPIQEVAGCRCHISYSY